MEPNEKIHEELHRFREDLKVHLQADEINFKEIKDSLNEIKESLKPLSEAYSGILFGKSLITGVAAVILAVASLGGAIIWVVNSAMHK